MLMKNLRVELSVKIIITAAVLLALMLHSSCTAAYANNINTTSKTVSKTVTKNGDAANKSISSSTHVDEGYTQTLLVHFDTNTPLTEINQAIAEVDGTLLNWIEAIGVAVVQIEPSSINGVSGQSTLNNSDTVTYVEADGWVYGTYEPDDPDLYISQRVYTADLLNLFDTWDYTTGEPEIVIAVLDTGITFEHPEFEDKLLPGYDFFNQDDDPTDDHGHGTHVAGTSAAKMDNGIGAAGICPKCSILPVKVLNQNNAGTWSGVAAGVTYAADEGANIIVMSLGSIAGTKTIEAAIEYAVEKGVLIVAAAGNINSSKNFYPAAYPDVMGVAATDKSDLRWSLSNYGDYVDISAPGHLVYGAYMDLDNEYDGHRFMSGTSMATPHVAGLAGLLWSQDPARTSQDIEQLIRGTAVDLGTAGKDDYFGHGRINPIAALEIGAALPKKSQLSGIVWDDTNANGLQDADETKKVANILIGLKNLITDETVFVRSNNRGFWQIPDASAGNYTITLLADGLIHTTYNKVIKVAGQQAIERIDVGVTSELPDTILGTIEAERIDSQVILSWQNDSDLINKIVVERSVNDSPYQIVGQNVAGTALINSRTRNEFVDTLPAGANESEISYRFLIIPGENYIEGVTVQARNARTSALLPVIVR